VEQVSGRLKAGATSDVEGVCGHAALCHTWFPEFLTIGATRISFPVSRLPGFAAAACLLLHSQTSQEGLQRVQRALFLVAADVMAGAFDVDNLTVLQKAGDLFVLLPHLALSVGLQDQRGADDLGKQLGY